MEPSPSVLTLLGKPDCHLCHVMAEVVQRALADFDAVLVQKDVQADPELNRRYALAIPVLLLDGQELARHRVADADLRTRLAALGVRPRRT